MDPGSEQRWLCFAGWREEGSADDVYSRFAAGCTAGGKTDSSAYAPTDEDRLRLEGEDDVRAANDNELRFREQVLRAVLAAIAQKDTEHEVAMPSGSTIGLRLMTPEGFLSGPVAQPASVLDDDPLVDAEDDEDEADPDEWVGDLCLTVQVDWKGGARAADVADAQDAVPGLARSEWKHKTADASSRHPEFYVMVDHEWAESIVGAVDRHGIGVLCADPLLAIDDHDHLTHVVGREDANRGYANGELLRSVCGRRFVPSADPATRAMCDDCADVRAAVELLRGKSLA